VRVAGNWSGSRSSATPQARSRVSLLGGGRSSTATALHEGPQAPQAARQTNSFRDDVLAASGHLPVRRRAFMAVFGKFAW